MFQYKFYHVLSGAVVVLWGHSCTEAYLRLLKMDGQSWPRHWWVVR